jgi:hypothetical protein
VAFAYTTGERGTLEMEATPEQAAEGLAIVRVLSAVLDRLVSANTTIAIGDPGQVTKFHAMKPPAIGIQQYLERYVLLCSHSQLSSLV